MTYPRNFSHLGIAVPDLEQAIQFYTDVFGWYLMVGPFEYDEDRDSGRPIGQILNAALGKGWSKLRMARLATGDRIGVELQEFEQQDAPGADGKGSNGQAPGGVSHICVQDPNVETLVEKIVDHGGAQRMPIMSFFPDDKPFRLVYCEDPFGNIIEVDSHSFEATWAPDSYQQ